MPRHFPSQWLDELRAKSDIVDIVSAYVPLKKNGARYWGLCPFHGEKTASFSVNPELQLYYCFGCKAGGSVIQFVMDMEKLDFAEAVERLADRAHMPLPEVREDPDWQRKRDQRERLLSANREAARIYHRQLFTPAGQKVLDYFKRRGLSDGVITKFGLGAAVGPWDAMTLELEKQGYTEDELRLCGLTVVREAEPGENGEPPRPRQVRDMFRDRAMFPIIDASGSVLGFGGRTLGDAKPKYLNTADTPVFNKRQGVYAANLLRKARHLDRVILVEGYMDVVSLTQFGVEGVCATLGTSLTDEQARYLKRIAPKVYLAYDGDSAGQHAILRGLEILGNAGVPARVLDFPDGLDPDEFIRRDGPEGFEKLPVLTPEAYRMRRLAAEHDLSTQEGRTEYARKCAELIRPLEPVEQENYIRQLMVQTGFPREVLVAQIGVGKPQAAAAAVPQKPKPVFERPARSAVKEDRAAERAQEIVVSLLATGQLPADIAAAEDFTDPLLRSLYQALMDGASPASLVESQPTDADRERVSRLLLTPPSQDTNELIRMARDCLNTVRRERLQKEMADIQREIPTLPPERKEEAMRRYMALRQELRRRQDGSGA